MDLIERFRFLYHQFGHIRQAVYPGFDRAQVELFNLTQALGHMYCPGIQDSLNETRRQAMRQLTGHLQKLRFTDAIMAPISNTRRMSWADFQITPEVSADLHLAGRVVDSLVVKKLNHLRRQQISQILKVVGV